MGNIFSYWFNSDIKYEESLLDPLNQEDIQYASLLDIESINGQVGILEQTTQSSLKNISTDVKYLFEEINRLKTQINNLCQRLDQQKINNEKKNLINLNKEEESIYLDAKSNNNDEEYSSVDETY